MLELALNYGKGPVVLKDIAKNEEVSQKYLSHIIIPLKGMGLVSSNRGAQGGYVLSKPPSQITLREIVEVLEGELSLVECLKNPSVCRRVPICVTRNIWSRLGDEISKTLASVTLEDLAKMYEEKGKQAMYSI
jgi:Rrf2 family protein